jgi:HSP20 family protein
MKIKNIKEIAMNNKKVIVLVAILAGALILETGYLLALKKQQQRPERERASLFRYQRPMPMQIKAHRLPENDWLADREQEGFISDVRQMQNWDPFAEIEKMQEDLRQMVADSARAVARRITSFGPNINIKNTEGAYLVDVDLPGMKKDEINVEVQDRYLTISGDRKVEESVQNEGYDRQEWDYGHFSRTITLPGDAKAEGIASEYKNGVLAIRVPKVVPAKSAKPSPFKVPVQ